jgi:hypothetical protein
MHSVLCIQEVTFSSSLGARMSSMVIAIPALSASWTLHSRWQLKVISRKNNTFCFQDGIPAFRFKCLRCFIDNDSIKMYVFKYPVADTYQRSGNTCDDLTMESVSLSSSSEAHLCRSRASFFNSFLNSRSSCPNCLLY